MTEPTSFFGGRVTLWPGDCLEVMRGMAGDSVDAVVTDPPAGILFMGRSWDHDKGGRDQWIAWMSEVAVEVLRVCKPGAHALVWALPRTSHWTATAWENAGWCPRDRLAHCFGSGFPKSLDVSKAIDKMAGAEREIVGISPYAASRIAPIKYHQSEYSADEGLRNITAPATDAVRQWEGWGTALKPAMEDWWLFRKPLSEKTVAENVLRWGVGALNIDGCRIPGTPEATRFDPAKHSHDGYRMTATGAECASRASRLGRWPANLLLDDSEEVKGAFPETTAAGHFPKRSGAFGKNGVYGNADGAPQQERWMDSSGSAARFFYTAKTDADGRAGSRHPTVKPLDLIQYLCRLICPPGGLVLDPFAGTGTTGEAAWREGMRAILIEKEPEYVEDVKRRMEWAVMGQEERTRAKNRHKGPAKPTGPDLFGDLL